MDRGKLGDTASEYDLQEDEYQESNDASMHSRLTRLQLILRGPDIGRPIASGCWRKAIIMPDVSQGYKVWTHVILVWAIYSSVFTPIEFGFFRGLPKHMWWFDQVGQIMFMIDIVVNFFVAYKDFLTYKWVVDPRNIALRYAKSNLIPDVLACLPWDAIYTKGGRKEIIRYLLWIRLYRVRKVDGFFRRMEQNIRINYLFTRIIKLLTVELYCTHTAACIFYYLATTMPQSKEDLTWIGSLTLGGYTYHNFRDIDLGRRYVVSLYFAIVTMATVGYGDIHAVSPREMVFVMVFVSFDMILGAYLIGNMTALIVKGSNTEKFRDRMTSLIKYMNRNKLDRGLRSQLKNHLQLQYESQFIEDVVVEDLPLSIRSKVSQSLYTSVIQRVNIFHSCSIDFIHQIGMRVHEEYLLPGEAILEQGKAGDQMYIVATGTLVEVLIELDGSEEIVSTLEAHSVFGAVAVLCSIPQPYAVRVVDLCKVLRLDKESLFALMHIYFSDGRQVLHNLLKYGDDVKLNPLETDISFLIAEQEVERCLKVNIAAYYGKTAHLKCLIKAGADPGRPDYDGRTPLHLAAGRGHEEIVCFLVQEGVDVEFQDKFGNTALIEAVKGGHTKVVKFLRSSGASLTEENAGSVLRNAVLVGNLDTVRSLLENGIDPNCSDHNGQTALHIAASEGLVMMSRVLLENGANPYAKDRWGITALEASIKLGGNVLKNVFAEATTVKEQPRVGSTTETAADNTRGEESGYTAGDDAALAEQGKEAQRTSKFGTGESSVKRRCTVFSRRDDGKRGLVVWVPDTIHELLQVASHHFDHPCAHILNEDGGEFSSTELIRDSEKVYAID